MKKTFFFILAAVALTACSKGPKDAAQNFTENIAKGNITEAKKYVTANTIPLLDMLNGFAGGMPKYPDYKFKMEKDSIVGDSVAWVTYITPEGKQDVLNLKKENGEWKVYMFK